MSKEKKLQKVTNFEQIKTVNQVKTYLKENPNHYNQLETYLQKRLNESYQNKLGNESQILDMICQCFIHDNNEERVVWARNTTYEINHTLISNHIYNYIIKQKCFPNIHHISEKTGLSRTTIYRHLADGLNTKYNKLIKGKMEIMTTTALERLFLIGIEENNTTALKNFIELSGALKKPQTTNINNYIQINNLRISKDEFDRLPSETIIQIEQLVSNNLKNI